MVVCIANIVVHLAQLKNAVGRRKRGQCILIGFQCGTVFTAFGMGNALKVVTLALSKRVSVLLAKEQRSFGHTDSGVLVVINEPTAIIQQCLYTVCIGWQAIDFFQKRVSLRSILGLAVFKRGQKNQQKKTKVFWYSLHLSGDRLYAQR